MSLKFKDIFFTMAARICIALSALIISVVTARFLGPAGRGEYFYIYSFAALFAQFCMLGLQVSNTYLVALQPDLFGKLTVNSAWVSGIFCTTMALIVVCFLSCVTSKFNIYLWYVVFLAPLYLFYSLGVSLFVGLGRIKALNYYQVLTNGLTIIAVIFAGYYFRTLSSIFLSLILVWFIISLSMFFSLYIRQHGGLKFHTDTFRRGWAYSFKAYIISGCVLIVLRTNVFLLKELSTYTNVGYFSVAAQMIDSLSLLPITVGLLLFPHLVKSKTTDWDMTVLILKKVGSLLVVMTIILWVFAPFFIQLLFGIKFMPAVTILRYLLPGGFFSCLIIILTQFFAARGFPVRLLFIWISGVCFNLILSYGLIIKYHAIGAALGMSITYGLVLISCGVLVYFEKNKPGTPMNNIVSVNNP